MNGKVSLRIEIAVIIVLFFSTCEISANAETPIPEAQLKPRNFNPHPYDVRGATNSIEPSVHIQRRRQSQPPANGIYSQGPVQFPDNANQNNAAVANSNPYQRVLAKARNIKQNEVQQNYDDYDQEPIRSKKHYAFSYTVRDKASGDDFSHTQQQRDGAVKGSYKVQLPDGRTQIVKYTADNDGYKAEVSYIEGQLAEEPVVAVHNTAASSALLSAQPIYDYYKNLQAPAIHERSGDYEEPILSPGYNQKIQQISQYHQSTPEPAYYRQEYQVSPTASIPYKQNYVQLANVKIGTYNTAPHHVPQYHHSGYASTTAAPFRHSSLHRQAAQLVTAPSHTNVASYPTASTTYNDIHVLPSPKTFAFATTAPYASPKSTNIFAPSSPAPDYYLDYGSGRAVDQTKYQAYGTVAPAIAQQNVLISPNHALYYKHGK